MQTFLATALTSAVIAVIALVPTTASAGEMSMTGTFTGDNDHITTGGVSVVKTANGGAVVILDTNFSLDGAPDPKVGFGKDGAYAEVTDLGELTQNTGLQVFVVPASVNVDDYNEVYIWCEQFSVSLGKADLAPYSN